MRSIIKIFGIVLSSILIVTGCNNSDSNSKIYTENKSALEVGQKLLKGAINIKQKDFTQKDTLTSK
ncbi:MAG: hypothetical protein HY951_01285 [Bacteroidia bacterium]|nr:hypothetical protein [Bacteroidia bacterium]